MSDKLKFDKKPWLKIDKKYRGGKGKSDVQQMVPGRELYKLSSNENMLGPSPKAVAAIRNAISELHYYPERTDRKLRMTLEEVYGHSMSAQQFLCANSGMELLDMVCRAFLNEGDQAIACSPAFRAYKLFTGKSGGQLKNIPLTGEDFSPDIDAIMDAIDDRTKIIFLNSPNNPTGTIIKRQAIQSLLDRLPEGIILVLDEVYHHFNTDEDMPRAYEFVQDGYPVIGINSLSKTYGLAGLRVGYLYAPEEIADYLRALQRPFQISNLAMEGANAALTDHAFIDRTVSLVNSEKEFLYTALDEVGIKYWKSHANFIMIQPDMEESDFEEKMLMEGVMVRPVSSFGAKGCVRVSIGTHEANVAFVQALNKIANP